MVGHDADGTRRGHDEPERPVDRSPGDAGAPVRTGPATVGRAAGRGRVRSPIPGDARAFVEPRQGRRQTPSVARLEDRQRAPAGKVPGATRPVPAECLPSHRPRRTRSGATPSSAASAAIVRSRSDRRPAHGDDPIPAAGRPPRRHASMAPLDQTSSRSGHGSPDTHEPRPLVDADRDGVVGEDPEIDPFALGGQRVGGGQPGDQAARGRGRAPTPPSRSTTGSSAPSKVARRATAAGSPSSRTR